MLGRMPQPAPDEPGGDPSSGELLAELRRTAHHEQAYVRQVAAIHPECPQYLFEALSGDVDPTVREAVATNPNCPPDLLEALSGDQVAFVRQAVATNPNCPLALLEALSGDQVTLVRQAARRPGDTDAADNDVGKRRKRSFLPTGEDLAELGLSALEGLTRL